MNKQNINRGAAIRAQKRNSDDAQKIVGQYSKQSIPTKRANFIGSDFDKLKVTFLGGLEDVGEKNMAVIEYQNQAIVLDCGNNLSVDLPGVNYAINDTAYLESIRNKLKAYVITHGHLDHMGGLKHFVPLCPAPIYGSRYTIGIIEKAFGDLALETGVEYKPNLNIAKLDAKDVIKIGDFSVEFIRVTHSLPDATAICISTPVGKIIATGDFRLDPEPLDKMPTDISRLKELGDQGVLLLLSESSYSDIEGRVPTESTLQQSFYDIIDRAPGRIFVAAFSSNMNRTQMIINAAVAAGRKVVLDGRGMLSYAEIAVRQGILKVPKGTIVPIQSAASFKPDQLLVMCTGGQGEPNAALQRMSEGQHKYVNLDAGDTVVISSSPIPGNEISYDAISNRLKSKGVSLFRAPTHELDGCGPLHVSGHARRDELREMIDLVRPKYFVPVHGGSLRRHYHAELAIQNGQPRDKVFLLENGDTLVLGQNIAELGEKIAVGSLLIDQNGQLVSSMVIKDKLMLSGEGIMTIVLNIGGNSQLLSSPDIISRGVMPMTEYEGLLNELRAELHRAVSQRFGRTEKDRFKAEIREFVSSLVYQRTGKSPIVIPVINIIGKTPELAKTIIKPGVADKQKRFADMRRTLLN